MKGRKGKDGGIRGGALVKLWWSFGGAVVELRRSSSGAAAAPQWTSGWAVMTCGSGLAIELRESSHRSGKCCMHLGKAR
jgi:hypothetical protein